MDKTVNGRIKTMSLAIIWKACALAFSSRVSLFIPLYIFPLHTSEQLQVCMKYCNRKHKKCYKGFWFWIIKNVLNFVNLIYHNWRFSTQSIWQLCNQLILNSLNCWKWNQTRSLRWIIHPNQNKWEPKYWEITFYFILRIFFKKSLNFNHRLYVMTTCMVPRTIKSVFTLIIHSPAILKSLSK